LSAGASGWQGNHRFPHIAEHCFDPEVRGLERPLSNVGLWQIVLQKSFSAGDQKFSGL